MHGLLPDLGAILILILMVMGAAIKKFDSRNFLFLYEATLHHLALQEKGHSSLGSMWVDVLRPGPHFAFH